MTTWGMAGKITTIWIIAAAAVFALFHWLTPPDTGEHADWWEPDWPDHE